MSDLEGTMTTFNSYRAGSIHGVGWLNIHKEKCDSLLPELGIVDQISDSLQKKVENGEDCANFAF